MHNIEDLGLDYLPWGGVLNTTLCNRVYQSLGSVKSLVLCSPQERKLTPTVKIETLMNVVITPYGDIDTILLLNTE